MNSASASLVLVENRDDGVSVITINAPEKRNAIGAEMALAIQAAFEAFDLSQQRVAIITGAGEVAFSSGADLRNHSYEHWRCIPGMGITTMKPVIAAVGGWCIGVGLAIAAMADLLVAGEDAKFYYPEPRHGVTANLIAPIAVRLPYKAVMELLLLSRPVEARRAYEMGLVNLVVPSGTHLQAALDMAHEIATFAPLALQSIKRTIVRDVLPKSPAEGMARWRGEIEGLNRSEDLKEGLSAFRDKRQARFEGR
jgi:enoyl-CoA hydratase